MDPSTAVSSRPGQPAETPGAADRGRRRLEIRGAVQGVGFRPFVYRLAHELGLSGWVLNDERGVLLEVEGPFAALEAFPGMVIERKPGPAVIQEIDDHWLSPRGETSFRIAHSPGAAAAARSAVVLPDLVVCADCRRELLDPADRRFRYPFINCTNCGPRFTIVLDLPYDRPHTTMRGFTMCASCRAEYENPLDRRFHAQPNACPDCGPQVWVTDAAGRVLARRDEALGAAVAALRRGEIVALKGLGGFQLLVDARAEAAVDRLRARKRRPTKPLAVMVRSVAAAKTWAHVSPPEAGLLESREGPIVLLARREEPLLGPLARSIAPGVSRLGLLLPSTPLHHLLFHDLEAQGSPWALVATSGNLSDEPIAIDNEEALARLGEVADRFLLHDRPIARHCDDGVSWVIPSTQATDAPAAEQPLRRARGTAPLPILLRQSGPTAVATGAHQKDVAALALGRQVFLSQHIGDMETPEARAAFERVLFDFLRLYDATPQVIAHDLHPDYPTTVWARHAGEATGEGILARSGHQPAAVPLFAVQHHHAHLASCLAEHGRETDGPVLGFTWDGTGFGPDGTIWGGEVLWGDARGFERVARLRPFRLPGGEAAVREPRRVALALAHEVERGERGQDGGVPSGALLEAAAATLRRAGVESFARGEAAVLAGMLDQGVRSPWTSSLGRLFDGVGAILGLGARGRLSFEGEAAMGVEALAEGCDDTDEECRTTLAAMEWTEVPSAAECAPGQRHRPTLWEIDWRPMVASLLAARERGIATSILAAAFHRAVAGTAVEIAERVSARGPRAERAVLSGGCFQNRRLQRDVSRELSAAGLEVLIHRLVPANDGGIALGQVAVARAGWSPGRPASRDMASGVLAPHRGGREEG